MNIKFYRKGFSTDLKKKKKKVKMAKVMVWLKTRDLKSLQS